MRNTTRFSLKLLVLAAVVSAASMTGRADTLVYNNTSNYLGTSYYVANTEFGDQITLSDSTTDRYLTKFMFEYTTGHGNSGDEKVWLRFYAMDGPGGTPGSTLFDSRTVPGYATDIPLTSGTAEQVYVDLNDTRILVPNSFTWTVQFSGVAASETVGLIMYAPPTVGTTFDDYWEKSLSLIHISEPTRPY